MSRRTKKEMESMKDDAIYYLLRTNNDPHKAWNLYIKEHLENQFAMPHYIKGIKDFISVSEALNTRLGRNTDMSNDIKTPDYIEQIKEVITLEKIKLVLRPLFKSIDNKDQKMSLVNLMNLAYAGELDAKDFTANDKRNLKDIKVLELLTQVVEVVEATESEDAAQAETNNDISLIEEVTTTTVTPSQPSQPETFQLYSSTFSSYSDAYNHAIKHNITLSMILSSNSNISNDQLINLESSYTTNKRAMSISDATTYYNHLVTIPYTSDSESRINALDKLIQRYNDKQLSEAKHESDTLNMIHKFESLQSKLYSLGVTKKDLGDCGVYFTKYYYNNECIYTYYSGTGVDEIYIGLLSAYDIHFKTSVTV